MLLSGCGLHPKVNPVAEQYLGLHEEKNNESLYQILGIDPIKTEWCAAFVSHVLRQEGKPTAEFPLWSRSYLQWGEEVDEPRKGDLVIFEREGSDWQGHVGFYVRETEANILVLGGNQNNKVGYKLYPKKKLLGIRRFSSTSLDQPVLDLAFD